MSNMEGAFVVLLILVRRRYLWASYYIIHDYITVYDLGFTDFLNHDWHVTIPSTHRKPRS
jgi:hypothetical protein